MDVEEVVIEELDESQVPESELTQFEETKPIRYDHLQPEPLLNDEEEEILLKKFINGEVAFPDYYTRPVPDDEIFGVVEETGEPTTSAAFQIELLESARESLKGNFQGSSSSSSTGRVKRKSIMNSVLQSLMGQANLCFARGQTDIAEKLCLEIIRQNPLVPEPYMTLAQIYETKDPVKSLQFAAVSAHLSRNDREQWLRLAEIYIEKKNYEQAKNCLSAGLKYCGKDYELRLRKAHVLELLKEEKLSILCYYQSLDLMPVEKGELCLEIAKKVSKYFFDKNRHKDAAIAMQRAYKLVPNLFTTEDINLFLELLILNEDYKSALRVLNDSTDIELAIESGDNNDIVVVACAIPDEILPEFRAKLAIILIHLKAFHLLDYVLSNIQLYIRPESGIDLYVDITEELIKEQCYAEVVAFLEPVLESKNFTPPPYVWLCYADCLRALNNAKKAISAYYKVVTTAPNCFDARLTLSALLKKEGKYQEAIKVLEQDADCDPIDPRLLYERCLMLKSVNDLEQYLNVGYLMLLRNSIKFRTRDELYMAAQSGSRCRKEFIKSVRSSRKEIEESDVDGPEYIASDGNLTVEDEYKLFMDLILTAYEMKKFSTMEKFAFTAWVSPRFRTKYDEVETTVLYSSLHNDDPQAAFECLRSNIVKNLNSNALWNLYSLILQKGEDIRYKRFAQRLQTRGDKLMLRIFVANYYLFTGSYKYALNEYMSLMRKTSHPLLSLGVSVVLNQLSGQKNVSKRATAQMHSAMFMTKYAEERMSPHTQQEIYYNMGRLHHSAGLLHIAVDYYEKGLAVAESDMMKEHSNILSLTKEIAFNLHLIYKSSGNMPMARKIIKDYIVL